MDKEKTVVADAGQGQSSGATEMLVDITDVGGLTAKNNWQTPKKLGSQNKQGQRGSNSKNVHKVGAQGKKLTMDLGWNIRGLNNPKKHYVVLDICSKSKIGIGAILETKLKGVKVQELMMNKFRNWDYYSSSVTEGRILIIWRKVFVKVSVIKEDSHFVHCLVRMIGHKQSFYITFVYDQNTLEERKFLWPGLSQLVQPIHSWMILGDFNAVFTAKDRIGGKQVSQMEIVDSAHWIAMNHLEALKSTGSFFTWTNNQEGVSQIYSKIDHVFINKEWLEGFPNTTAVFKWETSSDHYSCTISVLPVEKLGVKPFQFYNFWTEHALFKQLVLESWRQPMTGIGLKTIFLKTMRLKHKLKRFNMNHIGDIGVQFQKAKDQFQDALYQAQLHPSNFVFQDKVKFVAATFRKRKEDNRIATFINEQGRVVHNYSKVVSHFLNHFQGIMGSPGSASKGLNS
ncbi:uncharacterized protein LOC133792224 [Humulus lupulus]|uniref:uncharacterized protein LOC133792224 n=1 Tax=Humulus lupulus TaxID=3486 RepID=UPI002B4064E0|nr:uncharacterized protein LOC133792224 [Humulus lupulus]